MYSVYCDKELIYDLDSDTNVLTSPTLNLELNKAPTFEFTMPPEHPFYDKIERFKSIIQVLQDGEEIFKGRAIQTQDDMYKDRTVYCEGELAYLNDSIQRPEEYHLEGQAVRRYLEALIASHNGQVGTDRQFTVGDVNVQDANDYIYCYTNYSSTMDEIKEDLVDDLGGYLRVRNVYRNNDPLGTLTTRYLDYVPLDEYGNVSTQAIEFGENLLDFVSQIDQTDLFTGIIPLGTTLEDSPYSALDVRLTIADANSGSDYLTIPEAVDKYGLILKVVVWDDVTVASNLKRNGELYLEEYEYDKMVITATAADMHLTDAEIEAWRLGDMVPVLSEPHGVDRRFPLSVMSIPLDQPENSTVTLGTYEDSSLTAKTNKTESGLRNFEDFSVGNVIASAVNQATTLINSATRGYVTLHQDPDTGACDELLIMDTPDTDTAKKVWRWNMSGLGYSDDGYSPGNYGLAITIDGQILGTYIVANGMILADDRDETFGHFDDEGMKIYAQSGRSDLLLMSLGRDGMLINADDGATKLATFYSDGVKVYSDVGVTSRTITMTVTVADEGDEEINIAPDPGEEFLAIQSWEVTPETAGLEQGVDYSYAGTPIITSAGNISFGISYMRSSTSYPSKETFTVSFVVTVRAKREDEYTLVTLDQDGLEIHDPDGNRIMNLDSEGLDVYHSAGNLQITLSSSSGIVYATGMDAQEYHGILDLGTGNETKEINIGNINRNTDNIEVFAKNIYVGFSSWANSINIGARLYSTVTVDGTLFDVQSSEINMSTAGTCSITSTGRMDISAGSLYIQGSQYVIGSDERLKTSIEPLEGSGLDSLQPVTFKWKDGDDRRHYGYIAQQVQGVMPELVTDGKNGMLGVAYTEIIPLLHCKIKAQQAKIDSLEERIARLEALINENT